MDVSSIKPNGYAVAQPASLHPDQTAHRRQLTKAVKTINESGALGNTEMVFSVDRQSHRPVVRVVDKETREVIFQAPPDYVLNLADRLDAGAAQE